MLDILSPAPPMRQLLSVPALIRCASVQMCRRSSRSAGPEAYRLDKTQEPTMSTYSLIRASQAESARQFGLMLRRWRVANGWTQYTAKRWADEAGHPGLGHSGLSELENGLVKNPRAGVFLALGEQNARIAAQDFAGVRSRDLKDQLTGSLPIADDETGTPWGPAEFWSCHAGLINPPGWLAPPAANPAPRLSEQAAADLCASWAEQARELVRSKGGKPADLLRAGAAAPAKHREQWGLVVMGLGAYTPEQLQAIWDEDASEWAPAQWLAAWGATLDPSGGGVSWSSDPCSPDGLRFGLSRG